MKIKLTFLLGIVFLSFMACDPEEPMDTCDTMDLTYTDDIAAIINGSCAISGCHEMASATTFEMHDYASVETAISFGKIIDAINHNTGVTPMPFPTGADKLEQCTIDKITVWINNGAPE